MDQHRSPAGVCVSVFLAHLPRLTAFLSGEEVTWQSLHIFFSFKLTIEATSPKENNPQLCSSFFPEWHLDIVCVCVVEVGVVCSAPRPASVLEASVSVCQWGIKQFKKTLSLLLCVIGTEE